METVVGGQSRGPASGTGSPPHKPGGCCLHFEQTWGPSTRDLGSRGTSVGCKTFPAEHDKVSDVLLEWWRGARQIVVREITHSWVLTLASLFIIRSLWEDDDHVSSVCEIGL